MNCGVVAVSLTSNVSIPENHQIDTFKSVFDALVCPINYTPMAGPDTLPTFDVPAVAPSRWPVVLLTFVSMGEPAVTLEIVGVLYLRFNNNSTDLTFIT